MTKIQAVRGMNDILPAQTIIWRSIEKVLQQVFDSYGYQEIRLPLLEKTELFKRGIGEVTDIVEKEMYTFLDRNGESLTLRPEGTAGCVRAAVEHGLLYHQTQKLWYSGPMFRYERPQKGRYRQFYHVGVETFGYSGYLIEVELILLMSRCFQLLQVDHKIKLQINSLGSSESRLRYRKKFVEYCEQYVEQLDEDSKRRLKTNPLRILDSKNPDMQIVLKNAPKLNDFLEGNVLTEFNHLCETLKKLNIEFEINPCLVRGLDYYTGTVFEWITPFLGAQGTVCAGGRYDGLTAELGNTPTPAVGFALGMERLAEICSQQAISTNSDIYFMFAETTEIYALKIAEALRTSLPNIKIILHYTGGSLKSQFKKADKSGARFALIVGEDEYQKNMITFKDLRHNSAQLCLSEPDLIHYLRSLE